MFGLFVGLDCMDQRNAHGMGLWKCACHVQSALRDSGLGTREGG